MPNIKATPPGPIRVLFATNSHNVLLPSSGKARASTHSSGESVVFYLDSS